MPAVFRMLTTAPMNVVIAGICDSIKPTVLEIVVSTASSLSLPVDDGINASIALTASMIAVIVIT